VRKSPNNKKKPLNFEKIAAVVTIALTIAKIAQVVQSLFHGP